MHYYKHTLFRHCCFLTYIKRQPVNHRCSVGNFLIVGLHLHNATSDHLVAVHCSSVSLWSSHRLWRAQQVRIMIVTSGMSHSLFFFFFSKQRYLLFSHLKGMFHHDACTVKFEGEHLLLLSHPSIVKKRFEEPRFQRVCVVTQYVEAFQWHHL